MRKLVDWYDIGVNYRITPYFTVAWNEIGIIYCDLMQFDIGRLNAIKGLEKSTRKAISLRCTDEKR
ncbi:MAG: hypothetical protein JW891_09770 [Candidatus Lokiarchaeota archaeon]|nr:hypothetical protein [Candidatus Lokiarchaeota archaeon]